MEDCFIAVERTSSTAYFGSVQDLLVQIPNMHVEDQVDLTRRGLLLLAREYVATKKFATLAELMEKVLIWEGARAQLGGASRSSSSRPTAGAASRGPRLSQAEIEFIVANGHDLEPEEVETPPAAAAAPSAAAPDAALSLIVAQLNAMNARFGGAAKKKKKEGAAGAQRKGHTPGLANELAQARIRARLCIHCGQRGHMKRDCSNAADITTQVPLALMPSKSDF